jgi:hypothetical protein
VSKERMEEILDLLMHIRWAFDQYSDLESIRLTVTHFVGLIEEEVEMSAKK